MSGASVFRSKLASDFAILFSAAFATGMTGWFVGYLCHYPSLGYAYRMFLYQMSHPLGYVLIVSLVFAGLGAFWLKFFSRHSGWKKGPGIAAIPAIAVIISAGPGGMLWVYHDMCAGFFPPPSRMSEQFLWGFTTGLTTGPLIVLSAFPLNIIAGAIGSGSLFLLSRRHTEP